MITYWEFTALVLIALLRVLRVCGDYQNVSVVDSTLQRMEEVTQSLSILYVNWMLYWKSSVHYKIWIVLGCFNNILSTGWNFWRHLLYPITWFIVKPFSLWIPGETHNIWSGRSICNGCVNLKSLVYSIIYWLTWLIGPNIPQVSSWSNRHN